jgi:hypothetical protein
MSMFEQEYPVVGSMDEVRITQGPIWNSSNMGSIWIDEASAVTDSVFRSIPIGATGVQWERVVDPLISEFSWGPNGYGDPFDGFWRNGQGEQVEIATMESSYIKNCMGFLINKFGHEEVKGWKVYKTLLDEIAKRGINERTDWDGEDNQSSTDS